MKKLISIFAIVIISLIIFSCVSVKVNVNETTFETTKSLKENVAQIMEIGENKQDITIEKVKYEDKENGKVYCEATYDKFVVSDTFAFKYQELNAELVDFNNNNDNEAKKFLKDYGNEVRERRKEIEDDYYIYSSESTIDIKRNDDKIFSFTNGLYSFLGGAHGSFGTICYNYDKTGGFILKNENILLNKSLFYEKLISKLDTDEYKELLFPDYKDTIKNMFDENEEFNLIIYTDGIEVLFDPYLIGPWASSTITVRFDYVDNKDLLNNKFFE